MLSVTKFQWTLQPAEESNCLADYTSSSSWWWFGLGSLSTVWRGLPNCSNKIITSYGFLNHCVVWNKKPINDGMAAKVKDQGHQNNCIWKGLKDV